MLIQLPYDHDHDVLFTFIN